MKKVGIGTRVLNCLIDTTIIFLLSYFASEGWKFYVFYWHYTYISFPWFFSSILFLYYLLFESLFSRTPGKWLSISKVVNAKGAKPNFFQIVLRSLVRLTVIDAFFLPFLDKTLHDYVSKTEVVEA